ncbi:hypothetical protein K461DRAFT_315037 [Myriangium duriaei CBS 260.36]|uniref:Uncharacterized protein n=1 Tax=Myriangium duriaei CBS 260.36 TaxID=1168546 RepID=A0A9P4IWX9_9PEZI|nr:hypothetical protein K461DRAFT_315037 [Myriangium duriaei CBS 260.36]
MVASKSEFEQSGLQPGDRIQYPKLTDDRRQSTLQAEPHVNKQATGLTGGPLSGGVRERVCFCNSRCAKQSVNQGVSANRLIPACGCNRQGMVEIAAGIFSADASKAAKECDSGNGLEMDEGSKGSGRLRGRDGGRTDGRPLRASAITRVSKSNSKGVVVDKDEKSPQGERRWAMGEVEGEGRRTGLARMKRRRTKRIEPKGDGLTQDYRKSGKRESRAGTGLALGGHWGRRAGRITRVFGAGGLDEDDGSITFENDGAMNKSSYSSLVLLIVVNSDQKTAVYRRPIKAQAHAAQPRRVSPPNQSKIIPVHTRRSTGHNRGLLSHQLQPMVC